jgi:hypothetical protein
MNNLSMVQALDVWMELEDARQGMNGYGGDVAELYLYRFMAHCPMVARAKPEAIETDTITGETMREMYDRANESMHNLFRHFAKERSCRIEVEAHEGGEWVFRELGEWLKKARFTHRVHVKVTQTGGRKKCICHGPDMIAGVCPVHGEPGK